MFENTADRPNIYNAEHEQTLVFNSLDYNEKYDDSVVKENDVSQLELVPYQDQDGHLKKPKMKKGKSIFDEILQEAKREAKALKTNTSQPDSSARQSGRRRD